MESFIRIASVGDVADGEIRAYEVSGQRVALANDGGILYAFRDDCTHKHCALSDGEIEDGQVFCPCHGSAFDLETGTPTVPPATAPIPVFEVHVEGGDVLLAMQT